jgi:molybdate transport system substrate-binding protein
MRRMIQRRAWLALAWLTLANSAYAGEAVVAVAANFTGVAKEISRRFEQETGHTATLSFGSTGQLYTQIIQAAPFEVFLAADQTRPIKLEELGYAVAGSRFTYAVGKLVLWSKDPSLVNGAEVLSTAGFDKIAIANPGSAPYGAAAVQAMKTLGVYQALASKIVQGNNIAQAYQFVTTGNAELGFVALSQLTGNEQGSRWLVPAEHYDPIRQDAVLLAGGADDDASQAFLAFLKSPTAKAVIAKYGYGFGK